MSSWSIGPFGVVFFVSVKDGEFWDVWIIWTTNKTPFFYPTTLAGISMATRLSKGGFGILHIQAAVTIYNNQSTNEPMNQWTITNHTLWFLQRHQSIPNGWWCPEPITRSMPVDAHLLWGIEKAQSAMLEAWLNLLRRAKAARLDHGTPWCLLGNMMEILLGNTHWSWSYRIDIVRTVTQ